MTINDALSLFSDHTIAICDGHPIQKRDNPFVLYATSYLKKHGIDFTEEGDLYTRGGSTLSRYGVVFFDTQGNNDVQFNNLLSSFSLENIKVVVVGSNRAYVKIKDLGKKLPITVLYFNYLEAMAWFTASYDKWRETGGDLSLCPQIKDCWDQPSVCANTFFLAQEIFDQRT